MFQLNSQVFQVLVFFKSLVPISPALLSSGKRSKKTDVSYTEALPVTPLDVLIQAGWNTPSISLTRATLFKCRPTDSFKNHTRYYTFNSRLSSLTHFVRTLHFTGYPFVSTPGQLMVRLGNLNHFSADDASDRTYRQEFFFYWTPETENNSAWIPLHFEKRLSLTALTVLAFVDWSIQHFVAVSTRKVKMFIGKNCKNNYLTAT